MKTLSKIHWCRCGGPLSTLCLVLVAAIGCGGSNKPAYPSANIQGSVTIDGVAVKEGSLQFMPGKDVKGQVAQAVIVAGKFEAKNVPVGNLRVMFNITRPTGKMITEYSTPYPEVENLVPEKYRDGVDLLVSGNDNVSFDLASQAGASSGTQ